MSLGSAAPYESSTITQTRASGTTISDAGISNSGSSIIESSPVIESPAIESPVFEQPLEGASIPQNSSVRNQAVLDRVRYEATKPAIESDAAMLTVSVPENATVTVNEHPTTTDGRVRQFMSEGLQAGYVYTYVVKVTYDQDGEQKTDSKEVKLRAGDVQQLSFDAAADDAAAEASEAIKDGSSDDTDAADTAAAAVADEAVVTVVRLHVPSDAQVTLAGNPTTGQGAVRTFRTKRLKPGQHWNDYTVHVVAHVNGREVSKEKTINVAAGSVNELTFDFAPGDKFASR